MNLALPNPGVELQLDLGEPFRADHHLLRLTTRRNDRSVGPWDDEVGAGRQVHLKVALSVRAKRGYHAAALLYREAGAERRVAGHLGLADGLDGATHDD